jgi:MoxR-like ATPase
VPGVGKTMLARSLAISIGGAYRRVQCTPDLLPGDVTGVSIFNQKSSDFEFRPGPAFANVLLADEVNRATPRTQSALLECMGEGQVTVDGLARVLPRPFLVIATQNPIEFEGTFPLPEAQLDRFLFRVRIGYPSEADERDLVARIGLHHPIASLDRIASPEELLRAQAAVPEVHVEASVLDYIVRIVRSTRTHPEIALGASPRGTLALHRASQAYAAVQGRSYVLPDDVKRLAPSTLAHRLVLKSETHLRGRLDDAIVRHIVESIEATLLPTRR